MDEDRVLQCLKDLCDSCESLAAFAESHPAAQETLWNAEINVAVARKIISLEEGL